ncbi:MAG: hypothetical protein WDM77_16845 [Steroidobacteraceae bacterium]
MSTHRSCYAWRLGQPNALPQWRQIDRGVSSAPILTESLRTLDRLRIRAGLSDTEIAGRRADDS